MPVTTTRMCPATAGVRSRSPGTSWAVTRLSPSPANCRGTRPQLGAEQPQAHLDQPVTQVEQDHIGSVSRGIMIEGSRALVTRHRVVEAVVAGITPGTGSLGSRKHWPWNPVGGVASVRSLWWASPAAVRTTRSKLPAPD